MWIHNHEVRSSILGPATRKYSKTLCFFSFILTFPVYHTAFPRHSSQNDNFVHQNADFVDKDSKTATFVHQNVDFVDKA